MPGPDVLTCLDLSFVVIRVFRGAWIYIVLIAILLCLGVIWCHALIRFIMGIYHFPNNGATNRTLLPLDMAEAASYAQPNQPIHVIMAGDDSEERLSENHGDIGAQITVPPPAYGLWQSSVVSEQYHLQTSDCTANLHTEA
jgi:hypothetical protein